MKIPKFLKVLFKRFHSLNHTPQTLEPAPEPAIDPSRTLPPGAVGVICTLDPSSPTGFKITGYCLEDPWKKTEPTEAPTEA